ncbi:toprim domain-containing protein [Candidatus Sumerlaeota bacterium]|nr:toprim domain-containing protein [Candidatus Sumerlaeota bacterium]
MSNLHPIEQIKDAITCSEYATQHLGLNLDRNGRGVSFRPEAGNPTSLMVNERDWFDFGGNFGGDVIALCAHAKYGGQMGPAIRELAQLCGITEKAPIPHDEGIEQYALQAHQNLTPEVRDYLHQRGLTDAMIDELKLGLGGPGQHEGRITVPYWKSRKIVYLASRAWLDQTGQPKYKKHRRGPWTDHPIWGSDSIGHAGPVIIAEGAFDAITALQAAFPTLSPITGAFSREQLKDVVSLLRGRQAIICFDYDPDSQAGQKATRKLADFLWSKGIASKVLMLEDHADSKDRKVDLNDLHSKGVDVKALLLEKSVDYFQVRIREISQLEVTERKNKLAQFLQHAARCFPWPDVAEMADHAKSLESWSDVWLSELKKTLQKAPSDDIIVAEVKKQHMLIYNEHLGWYEYDETKGVWTRRYDTEIEAYCAQVLGRYKTGPRIASAYKCCKTEFCNHTPLNLCPLINFRSGMLDPENLHMKPHGPDWRSTIQMNYDYDPAADCPLWRDFIDDITDGDPERKRVLQQMFGYAMSNDRRYQKSFFLVGDGSNGKSVLLNILSQLLGKDNVSNVEIASLNEPFQRISLYGKRVNIACETETRVKGTEQIFKQIVAGDSISGCYKGKDFITFRPTTLMIFAANEFSETSDLTHGFLRRIQFVQFPIRFVQDPKLANERPKDQMIETKLMEELPGIAVWALYGLKDLRINDGFAETEEQRTMMKEFVEKSSPLQLWLDDWPDGYMETWTQRKTVYTHYTDWAKDNNCRPLSARRFWPELRKHVSFVETRSGTGRCVMLKSPEQVTA